MAVEGKPANVVPNPKSNVILLVDDEDKVRKWIRGMLQRCGFTVLEAGGGAEALGICAQHKHSISLSLIDISMPGMNGLELAARLQRFSPKMKVLFMSGYIEETLWRDYSVRIAEIPFIQKPFKLDALAKKIQELLAVPS